MHMILFVYKKHTSLIKILINGKENGEGVFFTILFHITVLAKLYLSGNILNMKLSV